MFDGSPLKIQGESGGTWDIFRKCCTSVGKTVPRTDVYTYSQTLKCPNVVKAAALEVDFLLYTIRLYLHDSLHRRISLFLYDISIIIYNN